MKIDVSGAVLIFDEAHNIEDTCREVVSLDLELKDIQEVAGQFMVRCACFALLCHTEGAQRQHRSSAAATCGLLHPTSVVPGAALLVTTLRSLAICAGYLAVCVWVTHCCCAGQNASNTAPAECACHYSSLGQGMVHLMNWLAERAESSDLRQDGFERAGVMWRGQQVCCHSHQQYHLCCRRVVC